MADEDISLTEDQLLDTLDDPTNGDSEFLNEVNIDIPFLCVIFKCFCFEWQNCT